MTAASHKTFNTGGPCDPAFHYMLPALPRLPDVQGLINERRYFVLHAPRQSGKTTAVMAMAERLNAEGAHYALYCTLERLRSVDDRAEAMSLLVANLFDALEDSGAEALARAADDGALAGLEARPNFKGAPVQIWLRELCRLLDKDLVVFFDEVDCLEDRVTLSFLSQLRAGYVERGRKPFPRSMALVGMSDIRDYKVRMRPGSESLGSASPFNIITKALTIPNFTVNEVKALYAQHTEATGQVFEEGAVQRAWYWSEGQPWLVNALALETVEEILAGDFQLAIIADLIDQAADRLMRRRGTHLDSLLARLHEPRVRRLIEPMLAASEDSAFNDPSGVGIDSLDDDLQYCLDLGLVKSDEGLRPANPIYACVMVRHLNKNIQPQLPKELSGRWMDSQGVDMNGLLKAFQQFWALNSEKYLSGLLFVEAGPHLLLTAFLQRVVNGGATVVNEFADGLGYADIVIQHANRGYVIELKTKGNERSRAKSREQLLRYMDGLMAKEGWLVVFDRAFGKSWAEKLTWEDVELPGGRTIHVVGC